MFELGTRIEMTKGYKGVKGVILDRTQSPYEFYIVSLENGIQLVAGPTAFVSAETGEDGPQSASPPK